MRRDPDYSGLVEVGRLATVVAMVKKHEWQKALDAVASVLGVAGSGAALFDATKRYHGLRSNPRLILTLRCAGCAANIYLRVEQLASHYFGGGHAAPQVECECGQQTGHDYVSVVTERNA